MCSRFVLLILITLSSVLSAMAQMQIDYSDMAQSGDGYIYAVKRFNVGDLKVSDLNRMGWDISKYKPDTYDTVRFYNKLRDGEIPDQEKYGIHHHGFV